MTDPQPAFDALALPAILIAGGNPITRARLRDWAEHEFGDRRALVAGGPDEVVRLAGHEWLGITLVDIDLPGLQGLELLRLVRALAPGAATVALSAYHVDSFRDYAIGAGAVACVSPQALDGSLRQLVATLLARAAPARAAS